MGILKSLLSAAAAYVPTNWVTGDTITADRLNHIEEGIKNNECKIVIVNMNGNNPYTLDKTWNELVEIIENGYAPVLNLNNFAFSIDPDRRLYTNCPIVAVELEEDGVTEYSARIADIEITLTCSDPDDYPLIDFTT